MLTFYYPVGTNNTNNPYCQIIYYVRVKSPVKEVSTKRLNTGANAKYAPRFKTKDKKKKL
ncbi:MAG: hypothetical protein ACLFNU_03030 [Bacteroidales bacterium]